MLLMTQATPTRTTAMAPSSSSALFLSSASDLPIDVTSPLLNSTVAVVTSPPTPHPDEPNLYTIPSPLSAVYRPLPVILQLALGIVSMFLAVATTWDRLNWLQLRLPQSSIRIARWWTVPSIRNIPFRKLAVVAIKALGLYVVTTSALQDFLPRCKPARVSTEILATNYHLPSPLSRYASAGALSNRVHWLEYGKRNGSSSVEFHAVYVNHGFGASSLSWLPAMPRLAEHLGSPVLGHDAPGFGFTDRIDHDLQYYSIQNSATIGTSLLQEHLGHNNNSTVLLLGHSMGCLTTLRMSLQLDASIQQRIVLVAPAFGLRPQDKLRQQREKTMLSRWLDRSLGRPAGRVLSGVASYALRRVVGRCNFWRNGLSFAWGDAARLKDSDVLRFQWPSIGRGWEQGMLHFARVQATGRSLDYNTDQELLRAVLGLPNVRSVDVIVGSKDRVMPIQQVRRFFLDFPKIKIVEMERLGHDPFEEDAEFFVETVQSMLRETKVI
jgi:pimeloyl-ACP methyl ester carboxylesterase